MPSDVASLALKLSQKTKRNGSRAMAYHFYAVNALKAGHPALARQAAGAVYKIYPGADPKRVGTLKAALVIDRRVGVSKASTKGVWWTIFFKLWFFVRR